MKKKNLLLLVIPMLLLVFCFGVFAQDNSNVVSSGLAPRIQSQSIVYPTNLLSFNSRAFAYNAYGTPVALGPFKMWLSAPLTMTSLATDPLSANFVQAGSFANGFWYGARYGTNQLVKIDTSTGVITTVATITGITSLTGMAWDATTNTMYGSDYGTSNKLGTMNLTTGVFTPLSGVVGTGLLIDIACSNSGQIYGHMITSTTTQSQIYSINKTTGVGTALSATTGFIANYAQGMSWDHSVDTGYLAAYNYGNSTGELRKINIATGATTLVAALNCEGDGMMIPGGQSVPQPCSNFSYHWTTGLAVIPDGATNCSRVIPCGIIINDTGYVYVMGGGTPTNLNRCYNTVTNTWTTKTVLPVALATTNGTTVKDSIYIIGGYTGGVSSAVYKYNPRTDAWVTKTSMPAPGSSFPADMCIVPWRDSLIICAGGGTGLFSASAATNAVRYYNVYTDSWVDITGTSPYPVQMGMMAATIVGDTIFTFGGYNFSGTTVGTAYRGIISATSPLTITWSTIAPIPATFNTTGTTYRASAATIKSINGGVLIVGGADASGNYNGTAYIYNPCLNAYTTLTSTTGSAKSNMGARLFAFKDSVVYLAAGYNAAGQTSVLKFSAACYSCIVTGIGNNNENIPENYSLSQNYPNPFNPTTKINYSIAKTGFVTMKIYNILGQEVSTLVNESKAAGNYIIDFNGTNFSSGIYFYTLKSGDYTATKRMTLIK